MANDAFYVFYIRLQMRFEIYYRKRVICIKVLGEGLFNPNLDVREF